MVLARLRQHFQIIFKRNATFLQERIQHHGNPFFPVFMIQKPESLQAFEISSESKSIIKNAQILQAKTCVSLIRLGGREKAEGNLTRLSTRSFSWSGGLEWARSRKKYWTRRSFDGALDSLNKGRILDCIQLFKYIEICSHQPT